MLRKLIKPLVPARLRAALRAEPVLYFKSYSQEGEDMVLRRIFEYQPSGFYVDVGAHHPQRYSNTFHFYTVGWRGINIDAMPGSMVEFGKQRPRDINVEAAVSDVEQTLTYHSFNAPALNGFDVAMSEERDGRDGYHIIERRQIKTRRLDDLLRQYLPAGTTIDFMTVDVEGLDLQVLRSNDWEQYRPSVILVEDLEVSSWKHIDGSGTTRFLRERGYEPYASTVHTTFYRRSDFEMRGPPAQAPAATNPDTRA